MFTIIDDNALRQMVDSFEQNVKLARSLFLQAVPKTDAQNQAKTHSLENVDRFWTQLVIEKEFTKKYLATDVTKKRQLFLQR